MSEIESLSDCSSESEYDSDCESDSESEQEQEQQPSPDNLDQLDNLEQQPDNLDKLNKLDQPSPPPPPQLDIISEEYFKLKKLLNEKKQLLLKHKLANLLNLNVDIILSHINNINFKFDKTNNFWTFSYKHKKAQSDNLEKLIKLEKNNKFCIKGNDNKYKVYIKNKKKIQIIVKKYEIEFDIKKHNLYINKKAKNSNTPEFLILNLLLYIDSHEWEDSDIIKFANL
jgi:hypothetical protein